MGKIITIGGKPAGGGGGVTNVTATSPLQSSGGPTPDISILSGTNPEDIIKWDGNNWVVGPNVNGEPAWAQYSDTQYTTSNRLTLIGGAGYIKLPNNAGSVIDTYLPFGVSFYDNVTEKITPQGIGEVYLLRVNFKGVSSTNQNYLSVRLNIGGAQGIILERVATFPRGAGIEHSFTSTNVLYSLNTFVTNGGELEIFADDNADIWDVSYVITRISANDLDLPDAPSDGNTYARNNGTWQQVSDSSTFTDVTPAADFGAAPTGFQNLSYSKNGNVLYLTGILQRTGTGLTPSDTLLCNLPTEFRPTNEMVFECSMGASPSLDNGDAVCRVKSNGDVTLTNTNFLNTNDVVRINAIIRLS